MAEYVRQTFDELMGNAFSDPSAIEQFNDAADDAEELLQKFESTLLTTDPRGPHYLEDITDIKDKIVDGFYTQLVDEGVRVDSIDKLDSRDFALMADIAAVETFSMRNLLPASGDDAPTVVRLSDAPYIDTAQLGDDDSLPMNRIPDDCWLQGNYISFVPMPAPTFQAYISGLEGDFATHVSVGAALKNAVLVHPDGSRTEIGSSDGQILVALTMPHTAVVRVRYQRDEVFTTPPEDI